MLLQFSNLQQPFFLNHWFVYVNRVLNWYFIWYIYSNWHFYDFLPLNRRRFYVDRLIDVDRFLYNGWHLNCHGFYHLPWHFFHHLHYYLLLHFNILRYLHYLFNDSLRTGDHLRHLNNHLHWFFNNDFFDDFLGCSEVEPLYLIFSFFDKPF